MAQDHDDSLDLKMAHLVDQLNTLARQAGYSVFFLTLCGGHDADEGVQYFHENHSLLVKTVDIFHRIIVATQAVLLETAEEGNDPEAVEVLKQMLNLALIRWPGTRHDMPATPTQMN